MEMGKEMRVFRRSGGKGCVVIQNILANAHEIAGGFRPFSGVDRNRPQLMMKAARLRRNYIATQVPAGELAMASHWACVITCGT